MTPITEAYLIFLSRRNELLARVLGEQDPTTKAARGQLADACLVARELELKQSEAA